MDGLQGALPLCWDNPAPTPREEASTSTYPFGFVGSGGKRAGAVQKEAFSFCKASTASGVQQRHFGFWH